MMALAMVKRLLAQVMVVLLAALLMGGALVGTPAFADSEEDSALEKNEINVRQLPDGSFLYDTSIVELSNADSYFDGMTVVITGEAMGEAIAADVESGYCWLTVYSLRNASSKVHNPSSIEVYASEIQAAAIDTFGGYGKTGSYIQVRGTFYLACQEHQGISDIHADQISVTQMGRTTADTLDLKAFIPGALLLLMGAALCWLYRHKNEGQK